MRKRLLAILLALALAVVFPVGNALADNTEDVTVTATPTFISITNDPDSHDFGVIAASTTPNTGETNFTITNDSTVNIDIDIKCNGWTGTPTNDWTYASPAGADTGFLDASDGAGGYDIFVQNGVDTELFNAVVPTTDPQWGLELNTPTSFGFGDVQETIVTLTASVAD